MDENLIYQVGLLNAQTFLPAAILYNNGTVFAIRSGLPLIQAPAGCNLTIHTCFGGNLTGTT